VIKSAVWTSFAESLNWPLFIEFTEFGGFGDNYVKVVKVRHTLSGTKKVTERIYLSVMIDIIRNY